MVPVLTGFTVENEECRKKLDEIIERYEISPEVVGEDNINFKLLAHDLNPHLILGTSLHYELAVALGASFHAVNYPTSQRLRVFDIPLMGYQGLLYPVQQIGDEMLNQDLFDETVHDARHVDEKD
jgi:nitrogenase molybdenum-iron protein alpha/beta subunit